MSDIAPNFRIIVGDKDISGDVSSRLMLMEWTDGVEEKSDGWHLTLSDSDGKLEIPKKGTPIKLMAGYDGKLSTIGTYSLDSCQVAGSPDRLVIEASAAPFVAKSSNSAASFVTQSWEATTLGNIVATVSKRLGMTAAVDPSLASTPISNVQQSNESDPNFLLRIVRRCGGYLKFTNSRLVVSAEGSGKGTGGANLSFPIAKTDVDPDYTFDFGGKGESLQKVKVKYHDYKTGETKNVEAAVTPSTSGKEFSNVAWLASEEDSAKPVYTPPETAANEEEATQQAKTLSKRIGRKTRKFSFNMKGRLGVVAGGKAALSGFKTGINGEWLITSITHRVTKEKGWRMSISGEGC